MKSVHILSRYAVLERRFVRFKRLVEMIHKHLGVCSKMLLWLRFKFTNIKLCVRKGDIDRRKSETENKIEKGLSLKRRKAEHLIERKELDIEIYKPIKETNLQIAAVSSLEWDHIEKRRHFLLFFLVLSLLFLAACVRTIIEITVIFGYF